MAACLYQTSFYNTKMSYVVGFELISCWREYHKNLWKEALGLHYHPFYNFSCLCSFHERSLNIASISTREKEKLHDICTLTIISFGKERNVAFSKFELLGYAACQDLNWKICICWWILYFRLCNISLSSRILSTPLFPWDYVNSMPKKTFT